MKRTRYTVARLVMGVVMVASLACEGSEGPTGPAGAAGADGTDGATGASATQTITGLVDDPGSSPAPAGVPVTAVLLDLDGNEASTLGAGLTNSSGQYSLEVPANLILGPQIMLSAAVTGRTLLSLVTGATQEVDAATDGVSEALRMTVSAEGGTAMTAFDATEVGQLVTDARAALTTAGTDLSDSDAVLSEIFSSIGTDISAASGVSPQALVSVILVSVDPPGSDVVWNFEADDSLAFSGYELELYDAGSELWDIRSNGRVSDGTDDSYDSFFYLSLKLPGGSWPDSGEGNFPDDSLAILRDNRTVVQSRTNVGTTGIDVTRKLYVSDVMSFARFTEVLTNPGGTDITVDVRIDGGLGSDEDRDDVYASSSGDSGVDAGDIWLVSHWDLDDPAVAWIFNGAVPTKDEDYIEWTWQSVVVPAGATVTLFHFAFQRFRSGVQDLVTEVRAVGGSPGAEFYTDATIADASNGLNGGRTPSVSGDGGAVVSGETLTIMNRSTGDVVTVVAGIDGSFDSLIATTSGDVITVVGNMGTAVTLTAP